MAGTYVFNDARNAASPAPPPPTPSTSMKEHGRDGCAACAVYDRLRARLGMAVDFTVLALLHKVYLAFGPGAGGGAALSFFDNVEVNAPDHRARLVELIGRYRSEFPGLRSQWQTAPGGIPAHINMRVRNIIERAARQAGDFLAAIDASLVNIPAQPIICAMCDGEIEGEEPVQIANNLFAHRQCIDDEAERALNNASNNNSVGSRSRRSRSRRSRSRRSRSRRSRSRQSRSRR